MHSPKEEVMILMEKEERTESEKIPAGQLLYDNIILWLVLGLVVTGVLYSVWGLIETLSVAPAP
jgi:hypothetical protein